MEGKKSIVVVAMAVVEGQGNVLIKCNRLTPVFNDFPLSKK